MSFGRVPRKEDARFVRGRGRFVDDIALPGMLHAAVLRSPHARARIVAVDTLAAESHPLVRAVITGEQLAERGLAWMPTLSHDVQAVLATDEVRYQGQEVAFVVAETRYAARDALALIDVEYAPLPAVVDARHALDADAPRVRDKPDNHVFDWEAGDAAATDAAFAAAEHVSACDLVYPRVHPAPLETCGIVADHDPITEKLTVWATAQAPHAHRVLLSRVTGIPEHRIRIVAPDIGGGFGNKVGLYPAYVCAVVASQLVGAPVKWVEDRSENLMATAFARDYHMRGEIAATRDGRITALRVRVLADHGAFNATAQPSRFPAGFFHTFTGSYDVPAAHCRVTGVHTNKAPGGVAYACSFRVTEASYLVERLVDVLAFDLGLDPAELRMRNLLRPEQFPYRCATGWEYDSGDYPRTLALALEKVGYEELRKEQAARRHDRGRAAPRHRDQLLHRGGGGRAAGADGHRRAGHGRRRRSCGCTRAVRRCSRCRACRRARATRRRSPSSSRTSSASAWTRWRSCRATPNARRSASAPTGRARRRSPGRPRWSRPARCGSGRGWSRRRCWRWRRRTWSGWRAASRCAACPARARRSGRSPWPRTPTSSCPTASRATWTRRPSTTRPTSRSRAGPTSAWWTSTQARGRSPCAGSSRWTTAACGSTRRSSRGRSTAASPTASGWR